MKVKEKNHISEKLKEQRKIKDSFWYIRLFVIMLLLFVVLESFLYKREIEQASDKDNIKTFPMLIGAMALAW